MDRPAVSNSSRRVRNSHRRVQRGSAEGAGGAELIEKTTPKRIKNQAEKCITFSSLLDPSWTGLEAILGPSWGQKSGSRLTFSTVS